MGHLAKFATLSGVMTGAELKPEDQGDEEGGFVKGKKILISACLKAIKHLTQLNKHLVESNRPFRDNTRERIGYAYKILITPSNDDLGSSSKNFCSVSNQGLGIDSMFSLPVNSELQSRFFNPNFLSEYERLSS